jgi:glycine/D-amino acid oxidase-like deaminating enzyme
LRSAITRKADGEVRASAEQWIRRNGPVSVLEQDEIHKTTGTGRYRSAMLDRRGGQLNPLSYARGLARVAMQQGAAVHGGSKVMQARKTAAGWRLDTAYGVVTTDKLILATNGYTDNLWPGLRRSLVPLFSAIAATEPLPEALVQSIMPTRSSFVRDRQHHRLLPDWYG